MRKKGFGDFFNFNFEKVVLILSSIICLCVGFLIGIVVNTNENKAASAVKTNIEIIGEEGEGENDAEQVTIGPFTEIVKMRRYAKSDSVNIVSESPTAELYGLDRESFEARFSDWEVYTFTPQKVTLFKLIDSYGPDSYRLTSYTPDGKGEIMAVFSYDEEGVEYLYKTIDTPLSLLSADEAAKVKSGIFVKGEERLEQLLENYDE